MNWKVGEVELYLTVTEGGMITMGINSLSDILQQKFPVDMRKQQILSVKEFRRYENSVFQKRQDWVMEHIPAGKYAVNIKLDSDTMIKK